jgi:hypothetical protein
LIDAGRDIQSFRNWSGDCATRLDSGASLAPSRDFLTTSPMNTDGWERPKQITGKSARGVGDHSGTLLNKAK